MASVTSALPTPWRYQGRILESAAGTPDLYNFGARSYNATIGTFTSLDTLHGSAQNSALLNGYLYADANPATLVDPDGHAASTLLTQIRGALILHQECTIDAPPDVDLTRAPVGTLRHGGRNAADRPLLYQP